MSEVRADSSTKKGIYMGQLGEDLTEVGSECNLQEIQVSGWGESSSSQGPIPVSTSIRGTMY